MLNANAAMPVIGTLFAAAVFLFGGVPSHADSTSARLAAYYDLKMMLCDRTAFQWRRDDRPEAVADNVIQVGVGRDAGYALTTSGQLLTWRGTVDKKQAVLGHVSWFAAGRTGVFAARADGTLVHLARPERWFTEGKIARPVAVSASAIAASVGDSADYFVTRDGDLFVKGLAHRGQYGDGNLKSTPTFIGVAENVIAVKAHTGHAIALKRGGAVIGTGGNIYGPIGRHGIGDKAIVWAEIFTGAVAIATGSSHSLALREDGSLWRWGRDIGLDPVQVLDGVTDAAADQSTSLALRDDNTLWQWDRGEQPRRHFQCP